MSEMFSATFDLLVHASSGVPRLRELILTLAVQGKLVSQDLSEEPAIELLQRIRVEKERLIVEGAIKRDKPVRQIANEEKPFELPAGWEWVRAMDVCSVITDGDHQPPPKADSGVPFLVIGDIRTGMVALHGATRFVPESYFENLDWGKKPCVGDVLYTTVGSFGIPVPVVRDQRFCFQRHIALIRPAYVALQGFLTIALRARLVFEQAEKGATGIAQKTVPLSVLRRLLLPLPPLLEQFRIVARVDELMCLCDELEAKGHFEATQHARLLDALLGTLTDSGTFGELAANWQRVVEHLDLLLDRPEAVDAFEQAILQLAVRGLLVPQDPIDEPADSLLSAIEEIGEQRNERLRVVRRNGRIQASLRGPTINLPTGWAFASFADLCSIAGGSTPSKAVANNWSGDIPWVSPKDMKLPVIHDALDHVSKAAVIGGLSLVPIGSLLMVVRGMILVHSFPIAETAVSVTINQDMKALTPFEPRLLPYLKLVCHGMRPEILRLVERSTHGTCKLESSKLFGLPLPIPPLAEQSRIIARVNEVRRLCADLRQRLTVGDDTRSRVASALVDQALV